MAVQGIPDGDSSPADLQLTLFRSYLEVLDRTRELPRFVWAWFTPIPLFRTAISVLVQRHIERILSALQRAYQLRRATSAKGHGFEQWTDLLAQVKALKKAVPRRKMSTALLAASAFLVVILAARILPATQVSLLVEMLGAILTLKPEKFAEIAAKPEAFEMALRACFLTVTIFIVLNPIIIYHFRFKRIIFNHRPPPSGETLRQLSVKRIWQEKQTWAKSVYDVENSLFQSLGEKPVHEAALDYNSLIITYGYYAVGPGLIVLALGLYAFYLNPSAGWLITIIGAFNTLIGFVCVRQYKADARKRQEVSVPS